ncbi:nucleotide-diphospho-sugar transferase [Dentipellis sp. KUC8613]|nr:nucleotide-diphospho-sugar transferase [Dentipellis sp. KUC8613]
MSHYSIPYIPLTSLWPSERTTRTRRWSWIHLALLVGTLLNIVLGWMWWHSRRHDGFAPLDDYQPLKDDFELVARPQSSTNSTAIVSSLYNDVYILPVLNLGYSLFKYYANASTSRLHSPQRLLLYIPGRVSPLTLCFARAVGWTPHPVAFIKPPHNGKGVYHRFSDQYTKLGLWTLDQIGIERAVYLDGDTLVRQRFDELFSLPFQFAAVPDVEAKDPGFSLGFNAGVLSLKPSTAVFNSLVVHMDTARYPLRMAEQAYLNLYFGAEVAKLPYIYNANLAIKLRSPQLWEFMNRTDAMRIVHYTTPKPFDVDPRSPSLVPVKGKALLHDARARMQKKMAEAKSAYGGIYQEEVGWWEEAWREMEQERRVEFERCERESWA